MTAKQNKILIIDFGSQYTQLIARRVRELGVYCEVFPYDVAAEEIQRFSASGIILSGSHASTYKDKNFIAPTIIFDQAVPILGICYGMQTLVAQLGGEVENADHQEYGHMEVTTALDSRLTGSKAQTLDVWMSHGDKIHQLPDGFVTVGDTQNCPHAIIADESRSYYGVQFHPEVTHTKQGTVLLQRFIYDICGCEKEWSPQNIIRQQIATVKQSVKDDEVILGLSGGVDSSVVAALLHQAIGKQLICIFVDTGLLRLNEGDQIMGTFAKNLGVKVLRVDAADEFYTSLKGVADPEQKRKIIGNLFVDIFQREAKKFKSVKWLAQGTIYPDVIESAGNKLGKAKVIKSHHNVGGLPEDMDLQLLEPLRNLFKDEVRKIGIELGLPETVINRHPFPGPGLGVRILGEVKQEYAETLRFADDIFMQELHRHGLYDETSQAFAVFLPVKSVGVVGDNRSYDYVIALRAVETVDFMTANAKPIAHDILQTIANRIINEVRGVSRVVYDISGKPPATIEWE